MDQREAFLKAIRDDPDSDTPRLVYADWLEEHGDGPRAEFIRIECEQAIIHDEPSSAPNRWDSPRFWDLEDRRGQLYQRFAGEWFADLLAVIDSKEIKTRRGFPWHVALPARRFIDHGDEIFRAAPTIEDLFIVRLGRNMPDLARCAALRHVRHLTFFETPVRAREAETLAGSPHLGNLRSLEMNFTDTQIGPRGALALARCRSLNGLERLDIYNHAVYDEGAESLFLSKHLAKLTTLDLGNNGLTDEAALALYEAEHLALRSLLLSSNHLSSRVGALADADHLAGLTTLALDGNPLGSRGAMDLSRARFADRLRELRVSNCGWDDEAVAVITGAAWPGLTDLSVGWNGVGDRAVRALAANHSLARLRSLSLGGSGINKATARLLGEASLPGLRTLVVGNNPLGADGVRALLAGPLVATVDHLDLDEADLGDSGTEALARSPAMSKVRWLNLRGNRITTRGAVALAESSHLGALQCLSLSDNKIGRKDRQALTRRFGDEVWV